MGPEEVRQVSDGRVNVRGEVNCLHLFQRRKKTSMARVRAYGNEETKLEISKFSLWVKRVISNRPKLT